MTEEIQPIRGMNDVLPAEIGAWQHLEAVTRELLASYGYEEIRVPLLERTELFKRAIGEHTDVVGKEMYTFTDRGGDSLTLRPEATAGIVRALITNRMLRGQRHKLWCLGPMFRHEAPQAGRFRQFWQVDVEAVGSPGPDVDAELIAMSARLWQRLGLTGLKLEINSLGTAESRREYRARLMEYFGAHEARLDADSRRRLGGNPLRILDSKNPEMQSLIAGAPLLTEHLDPESREHFEALGRMLDGAGVRYAVNPRLVRGLDYYNRTVFEWVSDKLGPQQGTIAGGGRYDGLFAQLGGKPTAACGFAIGVERLVLLLRDADAREANAPIAYVVHAGEAAGALARKVAETLRDAGLCIVLNAGGGTFKAQMKRADASGARFALIVGDEEAAADRVALKPLRESGEQTALLPEEVAARLMAAR